MESRICAAVLMPIPAYSIQAFGGREFFSMSSTWPATVSRWAFSALMLAASCGITSSAASVPGTVTVCVASATKMLSISTSGL